MNEKEKSNESKQYSNRMNAEEVLCMSDMGLGGEREKKKNYSNGQLIIFWGMSFDYFYKIDLLLDRSSMYYYYYYCCCRIIKIYVIFQLFRSLARTKNHREIFERIKRLLFRFCIIFLVWISYIVSNQQQKSVVSYLPVSLLNLFVHILLHCWVDTRHVQPGWLLFLRFFSNDAMLRVSVIDVCVCACISFSISKMLHEFPFRWKRKAKIVCKKSPNEPKEMKRISK